MVGTSKYHKDLPVATFEDTAVARLSVTKAKKELEIFMVVV